MAVLFVCLGNICRSPTAEALFRARSNVACDSAGSGSWHIGKPPYAPMQEAAQARGLDMSDLRARQFGPGDFDRFDLILCMDAENLSDIERLRPAGNDTPVRNLAAYAGHSHVPDPYFTRDFEEALDILTASIDALVQDIQSSST